MDANARSLSCAVAALGVALLHCVAAFAQPAASRPEIVLAAQQLTSRTWFFQGETGMASAQNRGYMSNAGFVVTDDGVVVFDALGTPALGKAMVAAIRKVTARPIRRIIVSHYHADHVYGLQALKGAGGEVWAHRRAEQYFSSGLAADRLEQRKRDLFPWVDEHTRIVRPHVWLEGDTDSGSAASRFEISTRAVRTRPRTC